MPGPASHHGCHRRQSCPQTLPSQSAHVARKTNLPGGAVFHVLNRGNQRQRLFYSQEDYEALVRIVKETLLIVPTRILACCLRPSHGHFLLWPERDRELSDCVHQMTTTHVRRWHEAHQSNGGGDVYQGRFKSLPVESDEHFYTVCRYVERNPVRAVLLVQAEDWTWSRVWARLHPDDRRALPLCDWPLPRPEHWLRRTNKPLTDGVIKPLRGSSERGSPYGPRDWVEQTSKHSIWNVLSARAADPQNQPDLDLPNAFLIPSLNNSHDRGDDILPHPRGYLHLACLSPFGV